MSETTVRMQAVGDSASSSVKTVPGPRGLPVLGVGLSFLRDPTGYLEKMVSKYGRLFRLPLGKNGFVFLNDANDVEQVLRSDFENFEMSQLSEELLRPLLGRSMPVVSDHLYWEQLHAIMLPMFTPKMLKMYFEQTLVAIDEEVSHLEQLAKSGDAFSMYEFAREGVFAGLTRTLFTRGLEQSELRGLLDLFSRSNVYINARNLSGASPFISLSPSVRDGKRCLDKINERIYELIEYRKANLSDEPEDMLDVLLAAKKEDGAKLTDIELRDNVMALLFGGQETTPGAIAWAMGLLAENPGKRDRMLAEIEEVVGEGLPTFMDLGKLQYCNNVLDEALRLYPAFTFLGREAKIDTEIGGFAIEKGTPLGFVAWTVHRDQRYWVEPDKFLPERHSKDAKKGRPKCALLSFGYGQRRCIGERVGRMESLLMLVRVCQKFKLEHVGGKLPKHKVQMSIKPVDGMPMKVVAR